MKRFRRKDTDTRIKELESELQFTKTALEFTKSSLKLEVQKVDELQDQMHRIGGGELLIERDGSERDSSAEEVVLLQVSPPIGEDLIFKLDEYEKKVGKLSELLIEEELAYKSMLSERDQRIAQLETLQGSSPSTRPIIPQSPSLLLLTPSPNASTVVPPVMPFPTTAVAAPSPSKLRVLETRIVDMTIALEEKDGRIFELDAEIDRLKVELNQMRLDAARAVELEERVVQLEAELERADLRVPELLVRIADHEATISELSSVIDNLRVEIDTIAAERQEAVVAIDDSLLADRLTARIQELELLLEQHDDKRSVVEQPIVEQPHFEQPMEMDSLEVVMDALDAPDHNEPEPDPWVSLSCAATVSCESLDELKPAANSVVELDAESTPDDVVYPRSPSAAKCGGCFTHLFRKPATVV